MSALPGLVERLLDEEAWREFDAPAPIGHVVHTSFREFVQAKPSAGLGSRLDQLKALCGTRQDLADRVQRMFDEQIRPAAAPGEIGNGRPRERGTNPTPGRSDTRERVIARLKRDDPALAQRVVNGEITANAAARQAGIRKPRIVLTSPASIARALRQHLAAEDIAELIALLLHSGEDSP
jgi:hypothetical protein